jgi:P-type Ca2+ transporter type 2C
MPDAPDTTMTDRRPDTDAARTWHTMPPADVVRALASDAEAGLTAAEVSKRLAGQGLNEIGVKDRATPLRLFLGQFNDFMIWVLMAAVGLAALEGQLVESIAIAAILLLNGALGFVQEYRAERALEALERMAAPTAAVIRDGVETQVATRELVPGDIVLVESGDRIPADGRVLRASALRVDEASLTGESVPASKHERPVSLEGALGDRRDMLFAGTSVAVGHGRYVVTETGGDTEMGRIAGLLAEQTEDKTPLQRELRAVGKRIALAILAICLAVLVIEVWHQLRDLGLTISQALARPDLGTMLTTDLLVAVSLAVAAIPEGLPAIVTVSLSLGVRLMARRNAIVRRLHAVETLGSTTFICSDKTGTLTRNEMAVRRIVVGRDVVEVLPDWALRPADRSPERADRDLLLEIGAACNDARFTADDRLVGDPTETALIVADDQLVGDRVRPERLAEVPFDSERKRMTTVHVIEGRTIAYTKGGADVVIGLCGSALLRGEIVPMTDALRAELLAAGGSLAEGGFRTLAFAMRDFGTPGLGAAQTDGALPLDFSAETPLDPDAVERDLTYVGMMGLVDPPRPEVPAALATCRRAGIRVAMVTGDHVLTASAIAREIGLLAEDGLVLTGVELEAMSDEELDAVVERVAVYARVDPVHKLRIVEALQRRGHIVAVTGDGVNDAPALGKADIGVAMGLIGTDVAREAADMVLADDDFATIVEAVRQGRGVYDNIRKFILYLLSCNASEVLIIFSTTFVTPLPALLPLQLLWNNLITDGLPALALGVDPHARDIMSRGPRAAGESILGRRNQGQILWQGVAITIFGLALFAYGYFLMPGHGYGRAQTMLFTVMVLTQLLHSFNFRTPTTHLWSAEAFRNRWLLLAFAGSMGAHMLILYMPPLQRVFHTVPLTLAEWGAVVLAAILPVVLIDLVKVRHARRPAPRALPDPPL